MRENNTRGITLIALIITVIVMLILAIVTVNFIIDSNLIGAAKTAGNKTETAYLDEQNLDSTVKVGDKSLGDYLAELTGNNTTGNTEKTEIIHTSNSNTEYVDGDKTATIPAGFTVSKITGETSIDGGLVIYDIPDGTKVNWGEPDSLKTVYNQFVWIPVEFEKQEGATYETDANFNNVWQRSEWEDNARTTDLSTEFTEPCTYDSSDFDKAINEGGTGIAAELDNMKESVYKYGGFYIARYEAGYVNSEGVNTPRTSSSMDATIPVFRQDAYPYNYVCWGEPEDNSMNSISEDGAVYLSRNISFQSGSSAATSMLCSGVAWDAMLDFIKDSDHNVTNSTNWGNYYDASFTVDRQAAINGRTSSLTENNGTYKKTANSGVLLTTGASERNKSKNIYDIAGNCEEWTTEAYDSYGRVLRGGLYGGYGYGSPAAYRGGNFPSYSYYSLSFRSALYVNL